VSGTRSRARWPSASTRIGCSTSTASTTRTPSAAQAAIQAPSWPKDAELKAIISADTNVPHGDVMKAIDLVKLSGVTGFALARDPIGVEDEEASLDSPAPGSDPLTIPRAKP